MTCTIAAIIPIYNGAAYIREALESVLTQDRQPEEIIVVDDGSKDDGPSIVRDIAATNPKVRLLSKTNGGQSSARNFGVAHSKCDLIALLDQDDKWYPHHLRVLERAILQESGAPVGWSYSNLDQVDGNGRMVCHSLLNHLAANEHPKQTLICCLRQDMFVLPGASLIKREAFDAVGGFDEQFIGYEDDDLFLRMFCAGYRSVYVNEPLTIWRIHTSSTSFTKKYAISRARYFTKLAKNFPDEPKLTRYYVRDLIAPRFLPAALAGVIKAIFNKDREALKLSCEHVKLYSNSLSFRRRLKFKAMAFILELPFADIVYLPPLRFLLGRMRPFDRVSRS
jgi:GT2 family glycosyltransferase